MTGPAWAQVQVVTALKAEPICSDTDDPFIDVPVNVCNVFVHLEAPSVKLLSVGNADVTTDDPAGFFQHPFNAAVTAPSCSLVSLLPSLVCDSFVTIGFKCGPDPPGTDKTASDSDFNATEFNVNGHVVGGWFNIDPPNGQGLPDENGNVLVAQLAVTKGFDISGSFTAFVQGDFGGAPGACPDFDDDGTVGAFDLAVLLGGWGACPPEPCPTDLNGDGTVGPLDLAWLLNAWGICEDMSPPPPQAFELEFSCFGPACDVDCDPAKTPENEPDCGIPEDTVNGGCNMDSPLFSPITCGESYCGTAQFDGTTRDTDWYELIVTEPLKEITWCATSEFDVVVGLVNTGGSGDCTDATALDPFAVAGPCEEACVTTIIGPGTWWLFVAPDFDGPPFACGAEYTATLTCLQEGECGNNIVELGEDCDGTDDAACPGQCIPPGEPGECTCPCQPAPGAPPNDCCADPLPILDGLTPFDTTGANTDGPPNPVGVCNDTGENQTHHDIWYNYTATCTGDVTVTTCADLGGSAFYDTDLVVYDGCDCPATVEAMLGCNDDDPNNPCGTAPPWASTVTVPVVAGNCYKVRVGGWGDADEGTGVLNITCPCFIDADCDDGDPCTAETCVEGACDNSPADCNDNGTPDCDDIAEETSADCNGNSIPDECDIASGSSSDIVGPGGLPDGIPDECQLDCNGNLIPDDVDISGGASPDCNGNGIPDECEEDCNANGVPDDCDVDPADPDGNGQVSDDCNGNGIPDECDIDPKDPDGDGEVSGDCNENGIPDECDIADCPPATPACDDCNLNGVPDECDIAGGFSEDVDMNGVPDECVAAQSDGDWSADIWGLEGENPYPDNQQGVPDQAVTLDGVSVFLDVDAEVPALRLINAATLDVTQDGASGDLTIADAAGVFEGNLLIEGTLNIGGQRMINAAGTVTIGTGGVYKSIFGFEGPMSGDLMAGAVVVECGGTLRLEGSMSLDTTGDFTLQAGEDDGKGDCTPPDFKAGDDSTTQVGGDFKIEGTFIEYNSTQPLLLGGDFTNQSTDAETFDWSAGGILLNGPLHTIEAAGRERGPCPGGLANNFAFGSLVLAEDTLVQIVDEFDNQGDGLTACDETVYVDLLEVSAGAILLTEGCRVYFKQLMLAEGGSIPGLGTDVLQILEGCPPDFSNDGTVGAFDLAILLGAWGLCPEPCTPGEPATTCATDLSGDCLTGAFDLALLLGSWGPV
ncbi:MAG: hypothetical protein IID34_12960 [Planctomycetes bacterium]|nr:hypothetical protein [Planctomycetota bacterium]